MQKVEVLLALGLAMTALSFGQTKPVPPHQREAAPPPARTAPAPRKSDKEIEAAIRAKLAKSKINADKFQVHVQGGVATWEGKTDVVQHKGVATRMAKTAGAIAVNNHIQVSDAAKKKAEDNLEKGRRRAQVKRGDARSDPTPPRTSK
jgi:BON domain